MILVHSTKLDRVLAGVVEQGDSARGFKRGCDGLNSAGIRVRETELVRDDVV